MRDIIRQRCRAVMPTSGFLIGDGTHLQHLLLGVHCSRGSTRVPPNVLIPCSAQHWVMCMCVNGRTVEKLREKKKEATDHRANVLIV